MSSWSGSAYPRGRSRSRSPYRAAPYPPPRPPYPDSSYSGQDSYRSDWEAYDRERAWANYERERAAYEYSRRGRSRSPVGDEGGRKRRRSLSPWERDRYEPRPRYGDDYDAHSRGYGYTSPHRGQYPPPPPYGSNRRAPPDPHTFDHPATLKQYAEWFRYYYPQQAIEEDNADKVAEQAAGDGSKPRNGIRTKWEKYRKEFAAIQLQRMFEHHRKSPWFAEKYDPAPEYAHLRARVRKVGLRGQIDNFLMDLETGKFDPALKPQEPEPEPTSPKDTNGVSVNASETTIAPPVSADMKNMNAGDDEMQFNVDVEEDNVDQEANRGEANGKTFTDKRGKGEEEVSVEPDGNQVMIRTIPPDIGRMKLEEACSKVPGYAYLALGEPMQRRNFYRAGWLRFNDDVDMSLVMSELTDKKIEGFKLHVNRIEKPFTGKVKYAPEVASRPDRLAKDLVNVKILASRLEEEYSRLRKLKSEAKVKEEAPNGESTTDNPVVEEDTIMSEKDEPEDPEPKECGSEAVKRRVEKLMVDMREQGLLDGLEEKEIEEKRTVIALDLYLAYLRAAFHTCYYCAVIMDHAEELQRKCVKHVRKPMSKTLLQEVKAAEVQKAERDIKTEDNVPKDNDKEKEKEKEKQSENRDWKRNDERWLDWLDSKVALLINRDGVDPRDYGGKSYDEELSRACEPFIKQEDEGKFRCKTCQKLFKATSFVEKHIANKHPELVKHLEDIPYFNNFALDPHHIQPFTHPPQQVGNSQQPPPQAYGLSGPAYPTPAEYGRPPYPAAYAGPYPPPYVNGAAGYYDPYAYPYLPGAYPPPRRDEAVTARRLSDRISGFAPGTEVPDVPLVPPPAGLPAKPIAAMESAPLANNGRRGTRVGGVGGVPPPPPPDAKEDPRAAAGKKVSYHDMDLVAEGDVELTY
ncbi:ARS2 family protein [Abortiporus biennis]